MKFVYVVDNIDWEERVHDMREHHQNKSACSGNQYGVQQDLK